jgi:hypothetical protein
VYNPHIKGKYMSTYNEMFGGFLDAIDERKANDMVKKCRFHWGISNGEEEIDTLLEVEYFYDDNDEVKLISVFDCDNNEHMESFIEGFQHNQKFLKEVRTA